MTTTDRLVDRRRRIAASGVVAVVSVVTAATAHAAAGGGTPSIVAVALALLVSGAIGMGVMGARLTRARAAVGVALDQAVFHTLFAFFGAGASSAGSAVAGTHTAHGMTLTLSDSVAAAPAAPAIAMVVTHLGAALMAYGMLRNGLGAIEAVAAALVLALARALEPTVALLAPAPALRLVPVVDERPAPAAYPVRLPDRRGPPARAAR